jgi:acetyl esterase/lipase
VRYGTHPAQLCELFLPPEVRGGSAARGVVAMIHGGYWRSCYDRSLQHDVAADLVAVGWAVWNVDYRGVGDGPGGGGGWPRTFEDVAAALDALAAPAAQQGLDLDRLVVLGHSAGGTLALWSAVRAGSTAVEQGAGVRPRFVVAQAAICDLVAGVRGALGAGAIEDLMGAGPDDAVYALASPAARVPLGVPVLLVTGADDDTVPPVQSTAFAVAARAAGDDVTLAVLPGEGHFGHLDPASASWAAVRRWLSARVST